MFFLKEEGRKEKKSLRTTDIGFYLAITALKELFLQPVLPLNPHLFPKHPNLKCCRGLWSLLRWLC